MAQLTFGDADFAGKGKQTRKERFFSQMEHVVPWSVLVRLIEPVYPVAGNGRQPYPLETMLRVHLMQNGFSLSDPGMEDALYDMPALRPFARLSSLASIPDEPASDRGVRTGAGDPGTRESASGAQGFDGEARHDGGCHDH